MISTCNLTHYISLPISQIWSTKKNLSSPKGTDRPGQVLQQGTAVADGTEYRSWWRRVSGYQLCYFKISSMPCATVAVGKMGPSRNWWGDSRISLSRPPNNSTKLVYFSKGKCWGPDISPLWNSWTLNILYIYIYFLVIVVHFRQKVLLQSDLHPDQHFTTLKTASDINCLNSTSNSPRLKKTTSRNDAGRLSAGQPACAWGAICTAGPLPSWNCRINQWGSHDLNIHIQYIYIYIIIRWLTSWWELASTIIRHGLVPAWSSIAIQGTMAFFLSFAGTWRLQGLQGQRQELRSPWPQTLGCDECLNGEWVRSAHQLIHKLLLSFSI